MKGFSERSGMTRPSVAILESRQPSRPAFRTHPQMKGAPRTRPTILCRILAAAIALGAASIAAAGDSQAVQLEAIARRYILAQQRAMEKNATASDVDAVLAFCTDSYRYVHPAFAAQVDGKDAARKGMLSHLGETSEPALSIEKTMQAGQTLALDVRTSFV